MGRPNGPAIELVREKDGRWTIELRNFQQLHDALGRDVLNAFSRCFVHSDRLTSLFSFTYLSERHYGRESIAFSRDLMTGVWFTIGTLRELATAIKGLRAALKKRQRLDPDSKCWIKLRELEKRWEDEAFYRKKRDIAAFHVDREVIDKGLNALLLERDVTLCRGDGKKTIQSALSLGIEALHNGLDMDLNIYHQFVTKMAGDHSIAADAIQQAFVALPDPPAFSSEMNRIEIQASRSVVSKMSPRRGRISANW